MLVLRKRHWSSGGVIIVVNMTMTTMAESSWFETTGTLPSVRPAPMLAKMSPTSLRGIMPIATSTRSPRPGRTPNAQASLPTIADDSDSRQ